jgi:rRNA maturation RNase YbeY
MTAMPPATLTSHCPVADSRAEDSAAEEPPQAMNITVSMAPRLDRKIDTGWIETHFRQAAALIAEKDESRIGAISVMIVGDDRMSELHLRHSQVAGTTDVLTFDLRRDSANAIEAEIVVCADEAARRAVELGHAIERELLLYCVHGLLHCAGYHDHDEAGWQRMHAREDEILRAVGVGATFTPERGGDVQ